MYIFPMCEGQSWMQKASLACYWELVKSLKTYRLYDPIAKKIVISRDWCLKRTSLGIGIKAAEDIQRLIWSVMIKEIMR